MGNKKFKLIAGISAGVLVTGGIGGGLIAIVLGPDNTVHPQPTPIELVEYDFEYKDENGNVINSIPGLKIKQYKYEYTTREGDYVGGFHDKLNARYYLTEDEINLFVKRCFEDGFFGPEIFSLKEIWIGNNSAMEDTSAGEYNRVSKSLYLKPTYTPVTWKGEDITSTYNRHSSDWFIGSKDPLEQFETNIKLEGLFVVFSHEYGHHIANSYMSNPLPIANNATDDLYEQGYNSPWNKHFTEIFKHELCYDRPTGKMPLSREIWETPKTGFYFIQDVPVGELVDAKYLFDFANTSNPDYSLLEHLDWRFEARWKEDESSKIRMPYMTYYANTHVKMNKKWLSYMYSYSELFTRKLNQLTYKTPNFIGLWKREWFNDSMLYESYYIPNGNIWGKDFYRIRSANRMRYLQDAVFPAKGPQKITNLVDHANTGKNIFDAIMEQMGQKSGADVSILWNNWNGLKFGGYLNKSEKTEYKYIGYFSGLGENKHFNSYPIITRDTNLGYKDDIFDQTRAHTDIGEKSFYVTQNWIPYHDDLLGKTLYFSEDDKGISATKMKTARASNDTDYAWTYNKSIGSSHVYKATIDSGDIKIIRARAMGK